MTKRVMIIGGGISGLAAAWELAKRPDVSVSVLEASDDFGGKLQTRPFGNLALDTGPDAFLARRPEATTLCKELGIADELVAPSASSALLWSRGRLRRLPEGLMLGVPTDFIAVARSGILSPLGLARAAIEPMLPGTALRGDAALGDLVRRRLGNEAHERLVDPLVGGINAGDTDHLSIRCVAPQLADLASSHRSLVLGSRAMQPPKPAPGQSSAPVFLTHPAGLGHVVEVLVDQLDKAGVELRRSTHVKSLTRSTGSEGGYDIETDGLRETCDQVIVTTPAAITAELLGSIAPDAARFFNSIEYASVALVALSYARSELPMALVGSGFLVPRGEGFLTTACSWASSKWSHLDAGEPDRVVLRVSAGRIGDTRAMSLGDQELIERLTDELGTLMNLRSVPLDARVTRWPRAFPQFEPNHLDRVAEMQSSLAETAPGIFVAGAALGGVGIPACIASGRQAAAKAA